MPRNEDGFSLDDMLEIFGEKLETVKPDLTAPSATVVHSSPHTPSSLVSSKEEKKESLSQDELAILESYEKFKKERKARKEEAQQKKEEESRRILEQYEKELSEAHQREARLRRELEERQQRELQELKKKEEFKLDQTKLAEEEVRIVEGFERQARQQKEKEDAEKREQEERVRTELKIMAEKQKADEEARHLDEEQHEAEFQAKAVEAIGDTKKESRLMELLAQAKAELEQPAPPLLQETPAAAPAKPDGSSSLPEQDVDEQKCQDFLFMLDETRKAMFAYLVPLIGIKASTNMLNKTVEKARAKAPAVLKDVNWRLDGSLREDGSVDSERMLANIKKVPEITRADEFLSGLWAILGLRFAAVEQGLGQNTAANMRAKVAQTRQAAEHKGIKKEWINLFYDKVSG